MTSSRSRPTYRNVLFYRNVLLALVTSLVATATACSGDSLPEARPSHSPHVGSTTAAPSVADLEAAVRAYSGAYLRGDAEAAFGLLSERCKERIQLEEMEELVSAAQGAYPDVEMTSLGVDEASGNLARVSYAYSDAPEIDQTSEPWVYEDGSWRQDDC